MLPHSELLDWIIKYATEHCWPPETIADLELQRLRVAEDLGRARAGETLQDGVTATLGIGGAAVCGIALWLPTP
jgi:hypothetical protein